jgi:hypothetical protein
MPKRTALQQIQKAVAFGQMYGAPSKVIDAASIASILHFAVHRHMRIGNRSGALARKKFGPLAVPDSLCGQSAPKDARGVEDFVVLAANLTLPSQPHFARDPRPCERCLYLYYVALANNVPIRHQNLDQVVNSILAKGTE